MPRLGATIDQAAHHNMMKFRMTVENSNDEVGTEAMGSHASEP